MVRVLLLTVTTVLLFLSTSFSGFAAEFTKGQTNAVIYCPGVADANPFDAITSGSVMQITAQVVGGASDGNCLASGGTFSISSASCAAVPLTYSGSNLVGGVWEKSGVTIPSDADAIKITCDASDSSAQVVPYVAYVKNSWPIFNVVDATNEGGDQDPTTTSFDTDYTDTIDRTGSDVWLYFPRTGEDSRQSASCNVQGLTVIMTGFNTTTKVATVTLTGGGNMPAAPDYRCVFRENG